MLNSNYYVNGVEYYANQYTNCKINIHMTVYYDRIGYNTIFAVSDYSELILTVYYDYSNSIKSCTVVAHIVDPIPLHT